MSMYCRCVHNTIDYVHGACLCNSERQVLTETRCTHVYVSDINIRHMSLQMFSLETFLYPVKILSVKASSKNISDTCIRDMSLRHWRHVSSKTFCGHMSNKNL